LLQYDYYQGKLQRDVLEALKLPNIQRQRIRSINEDEKGNIWNPISSAFGRSGNGIATLDFSAYISGDKTSPKEGPMVSVTVCPPISSLALFQIISVAPG
jgi:hypothetical protein